MLLIDFLCVCLGGKIAVHQPYFRLLDGAEGYVRLWIVDIHKVGAADDAHAGVDERERTLLNHGSLLLD